MLVACSGRHVRWCPCGDSCHPPVASRLLPPTDRRGKLQPRFRRGDAHREAWRRRARRQPRRGWPRATGGGRLRLLSGLLHLGGHLGRCRARRGSSARARRGFVGLPHAHCQRCRGLGRREGDGDRRIGQRRRRRRAGGGADSRDGAGAGHAGRTPIGSEESVVDEPRAAYRGRPARVPPPIHGRQRRAKQPACGRSQPTVPRARPLSRSGAPPF